MYHKFNHFSQPHPQAVLHRKTIVFKNFIDFRLAPVGFDIAGHKYALYLSSSPFFQPCSNLFFPGKRITTPDLR
jgi:hypothetical protein